MKHRHIVENSDQYSIAKICSILERGGAKAIKDLIQELKADPFGQTSNNTLAACQNIDVYGYPTLLTNSIRYWRNGQKERL